jgi:triacylglycerol lipase
MAIDSAGARVHIVLVPGFVGFDALGQLEYYAGTTDVFTEWQEGSARSPKKAASAVLHYFDNLPTASVATRAERLRAFLLKRIKRSQIKRQDRIALVGHSTGGLDIRHMLLSLRDPELNRVPGLAGRVDQSDDAVRFEELRKKISAVVFLSVPHWGTNLADWVSDHEVDPLLKSARLAIAAKKLPVAGGIAGELLPAAFRVQEWLEANVPLTPGPYDFGLAAEDALQESNDRADFAQGRPVVAANARGAHFQLALWLSHMDADFDAIFDLATSPKKGRQSRYASPAHFDEAQRQRELATWKKPDIAVRSYATRAPPPFDAALLAKNQVWKLHNPLTWPCRSVTSEAEGPTDAIYWSVYRACCAGAFVLPPGRRPVAPFNARDQRVELSRWENDGIVNTASMIWPEGETLLVTADHADVIGHFRAKELPPNAPFEGRRYEAYDFFKSNSGFRMGEFRVLWLDAFDFCVGDASG